MHSSLRNIFTTSSTSPSGSTNSETASKMGYDSLPPSSAVSSSVRARLSELRRPPIPPQSHIRVQKQIKLLKKPPTYPVGATLTLPVLSRSTNGDHGDYRGSYSRESSVSSTQYSRSPSPISSCRSSQLSSAVSNGSRSGRSLTPRRVFPQTYQRDNSLNVSELRAKEQSPVVFDGRMSFVLGCKNQMSIRRYSRRRPILTQRRRHTI